MAALDTAQLSDMLKSTVTNNCVVLGVYPGDMVPIKQVDGHLYSCADNTRLADSHHCCFILNTDAHTDPGEHWLAFFSNGDTHTLEYFDSFGLRADTYDVVHAALEACDLAAMCKPVNTLGMLQSVQSVVCGHYCVAFLHWRAKHAHAPITQFASTIADIGSATQRDKYIVDHVRALTSRSICSTSQFGGAQTETVCVCSQSCTCYVAK